MKEEFLHFLWKYQLFSTNQIITSRGKSIKVFKNGFHNSLEGPDFLNAKIEIDNQLWAGNVEVHVNSSDWYLHQHEKDSNYDAVILHVVWNHDVDVFDKSNAPIPTLELKEFVDDSVLNNYQKLQFSKQSWIPCETQLKDVDRFTLQQWFERLYIERLEQKSVLIQQLLVAYENDWEAVLFQLLAKNFGLNINGDTFLQWSQSFLFSILRKERVTKLKLSALFFGQANLLSEEIEDEYYQSLQGEYQYQKHKYKLSSLKEKSFQFYGMRPNNFPTVRIAQLAELYHQNQHLFSSIIEVKRRKELYDLFEIELDDFWLTHYTFSKISKKRKKKLPHDFLDLILINTVIPIQFAYLKSRSQEQDFSFELLREITKEKNSIVQKFESLGVEVTNAFESQSLIELKNSYCAKKRCLQCAIGLKLLKST